jgi:hypothetical protein
MLSHQEVPPDRTSGRRNILLLAAIAAKIFLYMMIAESVGSLFSAATALMSFVEP